MIGVGYIAKRVAEHPHWLAAPHVKTIYSVCECVSNAFMDYIRFGGTTTMDCSTIR